MLLPCSQGSLNPDAIPARTNSCRCLAMQRSTLTFTTLLDRSSMASNARTAPTLCAQFNSNLWQGNSRDPTASHLGALQLEAEVSIFLLQRAQVLLQGQVALPPHVVGLVHALIVVAHGLKFSLMGSLVNLRAGALGCWIPRYIACAMGAFWWADRHRCWHQQAPGNIQQRSLASRQPAGPSCSS